MRKQAKRRPARMATSRTLKRNRLSARSKRHRVKKAKSVKFVKPIVQKLPEDPKFTMAVEQYEAAVRLYQQGKYEKAKNLFEKAMAGPSPELTERSRVHINACLQRLERHAAPIRTPEDHYNMAVALINSGRLGEAEQHLNRVLKITPRADHVYYALAAIQSLRGDIDSALDNLETAIELEPRNRYLARNDRDFTALTEDPRFADLVYPEKNGA